MDGNRDFSRKMEEIWSNLHSGWNCDAARGFRNIYLEPMEQHLVEFEKNNRVLITAVDKLEAELAAMERQIRP